MRAYIVPLSYPLSEKHILYHLSKILKANTIIFQHFHVKFPIKLKRGTLLAFDATELNQKCVNALRRKKEKNLRKLFFPINTTSNKNIASYLAGAQQYCSFRFRQTEKKNGLTVAA